MRRSTMLAALVAGATVLVGGCSDDAAAPAGRVEVVIEDGDVSPKGDRLEVEVGTPVEFDITTDQAGELHVHSSPEQVVVFGTGTSSHEVTVDTPGLVEVELHEPEVMIVQLEVR